MATDDLDIFATLAWDDGLPRPRWDLIQSWIDARDDPDDRDDGWVEVCRQWLEELGSALGRDYGLEESECFLLLLPRLDRPGHAIVHFAEDCLTTLLKVLPGVADFSVPGKQVVVTLEDPDNYYRYISAYFPEGAHGGSAGIHVRDGYPHIALWGKKLALVQHTLAHEMTHACLQHLSLPPWVEEGLAQMFEHDMTGRAPLLLNEEMALRHKKYWQRHGLDGFWRGTGFTRPGRVQELSYQLAEILVRLLIEDHRPRWFGLVKGHEERLLAFLREANAADCGASAARTHLRRDLSELAGEFLGPGDWLPGR